MSSPRHALVFGGSGISGWAVTQSALANPAFARVTCVTNRPLTLKDGLLPAADPRLLVINGVDLTRSLQGVKASLAQKVHDIHSVTHIFFLAYTARLPDYAEEERVNVHATRVAVQSVTQLAPGRVQHVTLQTGGKWYGLHIADECGRLAAPLSESMQRFANPHAAKVFYYAQYDALYALWAAQRTSLTAWQFTELRPNAVVGFNPHPSPMNVAFGFALFLALQREVRGKGAAVAWPGTAASWAALTTDASQDMLGAAHVQFALDAPGARARAGALNANSFNVADLKSYKTTWADKWPRLCAYFGLVGVGPAPTSALPSEVGPVGDFVVQNADTWARMCDSYGLRSRDWLRSYSYPFLMWVTHGLDWDISLDVSRAKSAGFTAEYSTVDGYYTAFDRMVQARLIPAQKGTGSLASKL